MIIRFAKSYVIWVAVIAWLLLSIFVWTHNHHIWGWIILIIGLPLYIAAFKTTVSNAHEWEVRSAQREYRAAKNRGRTDRLIQDEVHRRENEK